MVTPFAGRRALITGSSGGIGSAVARSFADWGAELLLVDRVATDTSRLRDAEAIACDIGDANALHDVIARADRLDFLVNVAGMMTFKAIEDHTAEDWQRLLAVNLVAPALLIGHALQRMPPGSAIVNIASVHARRTSPGVSSYAASKAALVSLTRTTAIEGRARGIRCNAILPGAIDTAMLRDSPNIKSGAEVLDPADVGQPEDIAALARFLCSDEARFITGEDVVADGGRMGKL